ncbi:hypothetical protein DPMN_009993 [Dreissena polymorpha]|uniref:Uncharacterized protein n=1 Tax=Dreissena polymorpha TaxID=45954 RepID=A0A9D4MXZ5_DREPO|nr:hypothetical protein DPMN_009993 [Dreissena polymorpha]
MLLDGKKTVPPPGGHVFPPIWIISELNRHIQIFELVQDINETNVFTKNTAPPPGGHTIILTKLHEDWASNVTSTVFTSFELSRGINGTNVLTKFHEDRTINMASGVFTRQMLTTHDARRTKSDHSSGELKTK